MSSDDIAITVRGLSKSYPITSNWIQSNVLPGIAPRTHSAVPQPSHQTTLGELIMHRLRYPLSRPKREIFWALKDISFDLARGDVLGIIGRNGAGKSTLLKIFSSITQPTIGEVDLFGTVGSLLEVGTGFHPELTGRENIYLSGALMGMRKQQITRQFDEIVEFSGVHQFLDTPVKRYSSGMYVRLAFAVSAHLECDIMIVDEVLSVGDIDFQKKCLGKMREVSQSGRTVLFVSHHIQSVSALCNKGLFLDRGRLAYIGDIRGALESYLGSFKELEEISQDLHRREGSGELRVTAATLSKEFFECAEQKVMRFIVRRFKTFTEKFCVCCDLIDDRGVKLLQCDSRLLGKWFYGGDHCEFQLSISSPWLKPGDYSVSVTLYDYSSQIIDRIDKACSIRVMPIFPYPITTADDVGIHSIVLADFTYT